MTGERTLPGMGLTGFYDLGSGGWKGGMDTNLQVLSATVQLNVISRVASVPGTPTDGDMHLLTTDNTVALYDNGTWFYITPQPGWVAYSALDGDHFKFTGVAWVLLSAFTSLSVNHLALNTSAGHSVAEGSIAWNADDGCLDVGMANGVVLQVGQEQHFHVKASEAITNGDVVYASGAVGASGKIEVTKYIADNSIDELYVMGIATQDLLSGEFGYITEFGSVRGIPTDGATESETWIDGSILYASPVVAGQLTVTRPVAPDQAIPVAMVVTAHATNGTLFARPTAGFHVHELHDVDAVSPSNGDLLKWSTDKWVNSTFDGIPVGASIPSTGAFTTLALGVTPVSLTTGTGTPEGVVTAVVGSMFTRSDGGAGTTLYVKESGVGNTGWVAK